MKNTLVFGLISILFAALAINASAQNNGLGDCGSGYVYKEDFKEGQTETTYNSDTEITSVIVKAGNQNQDDYDACQTLTPEIPSNACYTAVWSNDGYTVTVSKTGEDSPDCKDISHVEFYSDGEQETESPSPSSSPTTSPTSTPTDDPEATPTPTPTATPTPRPTPAPKDAGEVDYPKGNGSSSSPQGQVLGASTLAATGKQENIALALMILSIISGYVAAKEYQKAN